MAVIVFPEDRPFDIIPVGRIAIDFNPVDYYKPLSESTTFKKYLGGSPANIAVGMARLGRKVGFIAKVSADQFGDYVVDYFNREGIDTSHVSRCRHGENLGLTFTEILSESQSSILMYREGVADLKLEAEDVDEAYIRQAKAVLISGTALAASPSREAVLKVVTLARKNQVVVIFDIDYRPYTWKNNEEIALYCADVAGYSDIILGSRDEFDRMQAIVAPSLDDAATAAFWHAQGTKIVVIKHGKEGSTAYTDDGNHYGVKPFPVKLLKSFGGGDGYASAFLHGLLEGWDIMDCLEFGSASAALLVASHACSEDMPSVEQVVRFIRESKEKYGDMIVRA